MTLTSVPPWVLLLVTAAVLPLLSRRAGHALAALASAAIVPWMLAVPAGNHAATSFIRFDVVLFAVDPASRLLGVIFGIITALTVVYAYASDRTNRQTGLVLAYVSAGFGAVLAGDWLTLLVCWELLSVGAALLIWSSGADAVRPGFRYVVYHAVGGTALLFAVMAQYVAVGSFLFSAHEGIVAGLPAALAILGIGLNAGFVGLHTWLPDTYPKTDFVVTVALAGFTTKVAVYALYRAVPDGNLLVAYMGGAMALFGVSYALVQTDMRRLLTYHVQSQVGYMVAGIGLGSALGVAGGFFHLFNNVLYKSLLFMVAGVIIYRTGQGNLKKLGGLARAMPLTFAVFLVAALSIVGIPGFNGYVSKAMVKTAAKKEHLETLALVFTVAGVGTTMSFAKFGYYAFLRRTKADAGEATAAGDGESVTGGGDAAGATGDEGRVNREEASPEVAEATLGQRVAMAAIAVLCVVYGLYPAAVFRLLPGIGSAAPTPFVTGKMTEAVAIATIGVVLFVLVRKPLGRLARVPDLDAIYDPVAFYGLRSVMLGSILVARTLDAAATRSAATVGRSVREPRATLAAAGLPAGVLERGPRADISLLLFAVALLAAILLVAL